MDATLPDPGTTAASDSLPRVIADRYTVLEFLGDGAFSEVYAAWDSVLARRVALKLVWAATGKRPSISRERFLDEARSAAGVTHRHIVAVHDVGEHRDAAGAAVPYLVMEVLAGCFKDELDAGRVSPARACAVLADVSEGLAAAHAHGVVHRDVKPANILLADDGSAKLGDFGIARTVDDTDPNTLWNAGTPPYLAPERFAGQRSVPASDVWAVGVVLYEALTGRRPFSDPAAVLAVRYQPIAADDAGVPQSLVRLLSSCLDGDPSARPPAQAVARALRHHSRLPDLQKLVAPAERLTEPQRLPPPLQPVTPAQPAPSVQPGPSAHPAAPDPPVRPAVLALSIVVDPQWYAAQDLDDPCPPVGAPREVVLDEAGVLVGRPSTSLASRPAVDLSSDVGISRRHCLLTVEQSPGGVRWSVEDLSSSNGTFVAAAGEPLPTTPLTPGVRCELEPGARIYLGAWTRMTVVELP